MGRKRLVVALSVVAVVLAALGWRSHDDAVATTTATTTTTTTVDRSTARATSPRAMHRDRRPALGVDGAERSGVTDDVVAGGTVPASRHGAGEQRGDATAVAPAWKWSHARARRLGIAGLGTNERSIRGLVVANGRPVPNASVYAGPAIIGTGSTIGGPRLGSATTGPDGGFSIDGLADGDLVIVAEEPSIGRSQPTRAPPGDDIVVVPLAAFGALSGTVSQGGAPASGVSVTCQSTTSPNALYTSVAGRDGTFRFAKLATDTYKVSATLGTQRTGLRFFSQQVEVAAGVEATVELAIELGIVTVEVTAAPRAGTLGAAGAWIAAGDVVASTASQLAQQLARGSGVSQSAMIRDGAPVRFTLGPGAYTACVTPLPSDIHGVGSVAYLQSHGDTLPAFCQPLAVTPAPLAQSAVVVVDIPPPTQKKDQ